MSVLFLLFLDFRYLLGIIFIKPSLSTQFHSMNSKHTTLDQFHRLQSLRSSYKLSNRMNAHLAYCEHLLESKLAKKKISSKEKNFRTDINQQFCEAYKSLSLEEKWLYYKRILRAIQNFMNNIRDPPETSSGILFDFGFTRSVSLKIWRQKSLRLNREQRILYAEYEKQIKSYPLNNYIMRQSKNTEYYSFVLEAINKTPIETDQTVHIGFKDAEKLNIWVKQLSALFESIQWSFVRSEMRDIYQQNFRQGQNSIQASFLASKKTDNSAKDNSAMLFEKTNLQMKKEIQVSQSLEKTIKIGTMGKSLVLANKEKSKAKTFDIQQFCTVESSTSRSNYGFARLGKLNRNLKYFENSCQNADFQFFEDNLQKIEQQGPQHQQKIEKLLPQKNTLIESLDYYDVQQIQDMEQLDQIPEGNYRENIFEKIFPEFNIHQIENSINYNAIVKRKHFKILQHLQKPDKIKLTMNIFTQFTLQEILMALTNPQISQKINPEIQSTCIKTLIKSENSAMIYQKNKPFNKLYRARDFIFLRHVFQMRDTYYIAQKSIQSIYYPPFTTIVRGQLTFVWSLRKVEELPTGKAQHYILICDVKMKNRGYLNQKQDLNLLIKYFSGFQGFEERLKKYKDHLRGVFASNWKIYLPQKCRSVSTPKRNRTTNNTPRKPVTATKLDNLDHDQWKKSLFTAKELKNSKNVSLIRGSSETESEKEQQIYFEGDNTGQISIEEASKVQKLIEDIKHESEIQREFDENGLVIISKSSVKTVYALEPVQKKQPIFQKQIKGHPIWKGDWKHDIKAGGIVFINEKQIEDQKGVLKFILSNIGKNLLSGKSVMNISLPVDIFSAQSNLQLFMHSFTYAPLKLEDAAAEKQTLSRFKNVVAFGISNSSLFLKMEKPFNPILGETFQCFIDGCPGYAEQISHHPPITALYLQGRGYKITGQFEAKIELHVNSGCGRNEGVFTIEFQDGMKACYITPGGEVSGLAYGQRKFNIVGKCYYWIQSQGIFTELSFNPSQKGFFSMGKQEKPIDYFEGAVLRVKPEFFKKFLKKRKGYPEEKQIIQRLGTIHGIWHKYVKFDDQIILDLDTEYPIKLQYEKNPLPSDANWREDIAYRRILDISRSQTEKERLQILQRKDRKLRQQFGKKKH